MMLNYAGIAWDIFAIHVGKNTGIVATQQQIGRIEKTGRKGGYD